MRLMTWRALSFSPYPAQLTSRRSGGREVGVHVDLHWLKPTLTQGLAARSLFSTGTPVHFTL